MSAAAGVPLTRELLEAMTGLAAEVQRDHLTRPTGSRAVAAAAGQLATHCAAALASDAGTPEGERVEGWTGKPGPCPNCGAIRNERDAHFCSSTRAASAPLDESGAAPTTNAPEISTSLVDAAAPEERDGEMETPTASLEDLLDSYRHALMDRVRGRPDGGVTLRSEAYAERRAIHAHVEQQKRAAREAGRREPGEADLRDAITSMTALEDELNSPRVTATFSYGDDADEIAFTGSDALDCCRQFIAWYRAVGAERGRPQDSQPAAGIARAQQTVAEDATADQPDVSISGESDAVPSTPMPDTPALAALREAENEARFRASHWCAQPDDLDAYRDAVAARVRAEEAERRAGPREPGEAERLARMESALKLAAKEFGRLWIAFDRGDGRRARVNELEQAMLDALAARPDAGDGTGEP